MIAFDSYYDEPIRIEILDTVTGEKTAGDLNGVNRSFYWWAEGNGSCDCNRELCFDRDEYHEAGRCLGCKRYLIVRTSEGDLGELNEDYPLELIERFIGEAAIG